MQKRTTRILQMQQSERQRENKVKTSKHARPPRFFAGKLENCFVLQEELWAILWILMLKYYL
jgi:hypothetical protein